MKTLFEGKMQLYEALDIKLINKVTFRLVSIWWSILEFRNLRYELKTKPRIIA